MSDTAKLYKKSFHHRNDSDELDVFEAARYFSGYNEGNSGYSGASYTQKVMTREDHRHPWRGGRMSLDVPMSHPLPQQSHVVEKQILKEKKYKQPSSPGARLASFLNSLFSQTSSKKKKKSKSSTTQSMKDDDESPGGRRKRRSSISHFRSSSTTDTKSIYSSSSSGFRTPPPCAHTPTKSYKDITSYSDHKHAAPMSKHINGNPKFTGFQPEGLDDRRNPDLSWLDEKLKFIDSLSEKPKNLTNYNKHLEKDAPTWVGRHPSNEKEYTKFNEEDDGAQSDSSSDLFELQNYDLGIFSSGLPVYETTHMDSIQIGTPISNGAT